MRSQRLPDEQKEKTLQKHQNKTEALLDIDWDEKIRTYRIYVEGKTVYPKNSAIYFVYRKIYILQYVAEKGNAATAVLGRIFPIMGCPSQGKRRALASVAKSIMLFMVCSSKGTKIWKYCGQGAEENSIVDLQRV